MGACFGNQVNPVTYLNVAKSFHRIVLADVERLVIEPQDVLWRVQSRIY